MSRETDRIPSLDGLRAISILLVLIGHLAGTAVSVWVNARELVTGRDRRSRVLRDLRIPHHGAAAWRARRNRSIRLRRFYFRRTLRIFPPYYVFIAGLVLAQALGWLVLSAGDAASAISYTSNYDASRSWWIGHTWSLSVEEQFYLLWPACLALLGLRRGSLAAVLVVLATPAIRIAELQLLPGHADGIGHRFETVADAIAVGCVLACTRDWLHRNAVYMRFLGSPAFVLVPLAIVAGGMMGNHPRLSYVVGLPVANVATALAIDWAVTYPAGAIGRLLNASPLVFVGTMSYSLYLWQQPFLNRSQQTAWTSFPLNLVLALVCALASYYFVERPALAFRRRVERARKRRAPIPAVVAEPNVAGSLRA